MNTIPPGPRVVQSWPFPVTAMAITEVYTMNADGSGQTNLTNNRADDSFPVWAPNSAQLAFTSDRSGNADIFVMNANGSNQINVTNNPANDEFAAWSPNGRTIAFSSDRFGNFDIFLMSPDGNGQMRLTSDPKEETYPAWSPDSSKLVYTAGTLEGKPTRQQRCVCDGCEWQCPGKYLERGRKRDIAGLATAIWGRPIPESNRRSKSFRAAAVSGLSEPRT